MSEPYSAELIAYAASRGIAADELPLVVDGCSGGLSLLYALAGRRISCEDCCNRHDIDYQLGGSAAQRREADRRLRECAARSGAFPSGPLGTARRAFRALRAWTLWAAVRLFGRRYWAS